jgi:signal transduction histidine kinase
MTSIRRYLTVALTIAIGLLLAGTAWLVREATRRALLDQFDEALATKAQSIMLSTEVDDGALEIELDLDRMAGFGAADARDLYEIRRADGAVALRSPGLREPLLPGLAPPRGREPAFVDARLAGGAAVRAMIQRFDPEDKRGRYRDSVVIVASRSGELGATLDLLAWVLAGAGLLALGLTVPIVRAVLGRGLAPVAELATRTAAIGAANLDQRLAVEELPVELRPIATELNGLVARLEASFERERRFSSDVAHELRTPLAELHTLAELGTEWPDQATPEAFAEVLAITREMEAMIATLRQLARLEGGTHAVDWQRVALAASIDEAWARLAAQASDRAIAIERAIAPGAIAADPVLWRSILANLLGNAVAYSPPGSVIRVQADQRALAIRNPAGELGAEDLPRLFERFWRKDASRTGYGHAGLGLALVRGFCELQGWRIHATLDAGALEVRIELQPGA